jgi:hypothetical protein
MASPHVVGAAALLISADPDLRGDVAQLEHVLTRTSMPRIDTTCGATPGGIPNNVYGWGRLDVTAALQLGHLTGTIEDQAGTPVMGASVTARDTAQRIWDDPAGPGGIYGLSPVSGTYTVTASIEGGPSIAHSGIRVTAGQTTTQDLILPATCIGVTGAALRTTPNLPWIGETVRFTGSVAVASLPVTYTWAFEDHGTVRIGNPVTHTFPSATRTPTTTVTMTATNRCSTISTNQVITFQAYRWYLPLLFKASL